MSQVTPFPLSAFSSLADGQPIACVQGVLVKLYPRKDGTNSVGAWSLQNGEIESEGITIPITFKDRDPLDQSLKGRTIRLTASNDKGMKGLYCWDDDKNGAKVRKIKVTPTATLDIISGGGSPAAEQPRQQQPTQGQTSLQNPPQDQPTQQRPQGGGGNGGGGNRQQPTREDKHAETIENLKAAKRDMLRIGNLHLLATILVDSYVAPRFQEKTGVPMSDAQRQATTSSIFIKADKLGLDRQMPVGDIIPYLKEIDGQKGE